MFVPDRRTLIVLTSLLGTMTVASGLLLLLEPKPDMMVRGISLSSVDRSVYTPSENLFHDIREARQGRWSAIVVRYGPRPSVVNQASVQDFRRGDSDTGYHFIIPAKPSSRTMYEVSNRWRRQMPGAYWAGPESHWVNHHAIGISLICEDRREGPTEEQLQNLVKLVHLLQSKLEIPADRVILQTDSDGAANTRWFPVAWFRQQLFTYATP